MIIIEHILGNICKDPIWKARQEAADVDTLILDQRDAQKSRCRKHTEKGQDLGIALDRNVLLANGDVIAFDEAANTMIVVEISLREVMVVNLEGLKNLAVEEQVRVSFELGHALGNQHWKAVLKDNLVYVPLSVSKEVMRSVMKTHNFGEESFEFVAGDAILPKMSHSEARLLFGGSEETDTHVHVSGVHTHGHSHGHTHEHTHSHEHSHQHTHEHSHEHGHGHTHHEESEDHPHCHTHAHKH